MELLLNLVWAVVAGTAIATFLLSVPNRRKEFLLAVCALCCALLLLFPTISVSDDLHFHAFVSEDSNPNKRLAGAGLINIEHFATIFLVLGALLACLFRVIGLFRAAAVPSPTLLIERPVLGRAPPQPIAA